MISDAHKVEIISLKKVHNDSMTSSVIKDADIVIKVSRLSRVGIARMR